MKILNLGENNSFINVCLSQLRDKEIQRDRLRFSANIEKLGCILAYEASKFLNYKKIPVHTPFHSTEGVDLEIQPLLLTIIRAGISLQNGVQKIFDKSDCAFFCGTHLHSNNPQFNYITAPCTEGKTLVVPDPIIATGKTIQYALDNIYKFGIPQKIIILSVISTKLSITNLENILPSKTVFITCAIDDFILHQRGTIPGLGDVGDLLFGDKI